MNYKLVLVDMNKDIAKEAEKNDQSFAARFYKTVNEISDETNDKPIDVSTEFGLYNSKLPEKDDNVTFVVAGDSFYASEAAAKLTKNFKVLTCPRILMNGHHEPVNSQNSDVQSIDRLEKSTVVTDIGTLLELIKNQ